MFSGGSSTLPSRSALRALYSTSCSSKERSSTKRTKRRPRPPRTSSTTCSSARSSFLTSTSRNPQVRVLVHDCFDGGGFTRPRQAVQERVVGRQPGKKTLCVPDQRLPLALVGDEFGEA